MDDQISPADAAIGDQLRRYVAGGVGSRDVSAVVAHTVAAGGRKGRSWLRFGPDHWSMAPRLAVLVVVVAAATAGIGTYINGQEATRPSGARVAGLEYTVAAARSFKVQSSMLAPYGQVSQIEIGYAFRDRTAFSIAGVDPKLALVLKLEPGQKDDWGPLGDYFLLIRGPDTFAQLCPYFDRSSEATPRVCK